MIRLTLIILLSLVWMTGKPFAAELQARISPRVDEEMVVAPGEIFEGVIQLWPYEGNENQMNRFGALAGQVIADSFYISEIVKIGRSANNYDVLEIHCIFALKNDFTNNSFYIWKWEKKSIPVTIRSINVGANVDQISNYIVATQLVHRFFHFNYLPAAVIIFLFLLPMLFFLRNLPDRILQRKRRREREYRVRCWRDIFEKATARKQMEEIYLKRQEWEELFSKDDHGMVKAFALGMEEHQYKKDWNAEEYTAMMNLKNQILKNGRWDARV